ALPICGRRLEGRLTVRGAKNASLKLMAAALMAEGPTVLEAVPRITDIETMISVLQALGAQCHWLSDHVLEIDPRGLNRWEPPDRLVRRMRASVQVMGPLLAKMGRVRLTYPGGCSIGARPIDLHLEGLRALGAEVVDEGGMWRPAWSSPGTRSSTWITPASGRRRTSSARPPWAAA